MSVRKRIFFLLALSALGFAAACADATAPNHSTQSTTLQRDGTNPCEGQGSTTRC